MLSGLFYLSLWTGSLPVEGVSGYFSLLPRFIEIYIFNANGVDPDQTPRSAIWVYTVCQMPFYGALGIIENKL